MQDNEPEFSPLLPDAPHVDRIGTAVLAMEAGAAAGVAWFGALTYIQTHLVAGSTATRIEDLDRQSFDVNFMAFGLVMGIAFAGCVAWAMMRPIPSSYRRGGLSIVSALIATVLGMGLTFLLRATPFLLLGLALFAGALAVWFGRRAVRSWE
ncbi:MAG: hypothetical protein ABUL71_02200 [Gemmatimonadota bacterium]